MLQWDQPLLDVVNGAITKARTGIPAALVFEGEPGSGKTTALSMLAQAADGFQSRSAEGVEGNHKEPFSTLAAWGIEGRSKDGGTISPFVAAQQVRDMVDGLGRAGPVLLTIDDFQWADPESRQALVWLLRRASGDRLLIGVGLRPTLRSIDRAWRDWADHAPEVSQVRMDGLSFEAALRLIHNDHPEMATPVCRRLWEHTSGNPLFLTSLIRERSTSDLSHMDMLPAPAQFASELLARLDGFDESTVTLLRSVAVLGRGWVSLNDAASVAGVSDPTADAQQLVQASLLAEATMQSGTNVRVNHALIGAAVYHATPLTERRRLHSSAADVVISEAAAFEHRVRATPRNDEELAAQLETEAARLHADRSHRLAARYLGWSSSVSAEPRARERRRLDSLWERILAGDLQFVRDELTGGDKTLDEQRRTLVQGALFVVEKRWASAIRELAPASREPLTQGAPLVRYRTEIMLAWARIDAGDETSEIQDGLARASGLGVVDQALAGYLSFIAGQVAGRVGGAEALASSITAVPIAPSKAPLDHTFQLAWRGAIFAGRGWSAQAVADLSEVERRLQDGVIDISDGTYYALLGSALWQRGMWPLAETKFRLAREATRGPVSALTLALYPLLPSCYGQFESADTAIRIANETLLDAPWPKAVESLFISEIVRLHAGGQHESQANFLDSFDARFGSRSLDPEGSPAPLWLMHAALASIWRNDLKGAATRIEELETAPLSPAWVRGAAAWLDGIKSEAAGNDRDALAAFDVALDRGITDLPLYRAHLLADRARLASRTGDLGKALESRNEARQLYERLGATPFLHLLEASDNVPRSNDGGTADFFSPIDSLSERERDVAALVATGMSYGQIAKAIFVSQSTVGFHLQRIYAKLGIKSRHELSALLLVAH
jgi:DNA-binding CsgD family transcriptional regulator